MCQKWSEVVWMDGRQSGVQKDRLGNFQSKNCNTELRLCTGFLRLLVASEASDGGVWKCSCLRALKTSLAAKFWSLSRRQCYAQIVCLQGEQNISVSYVN